MANLAEQASIWQREANSLYSPFRRLPFWRPRIVVKRGRFSPWFWPMLWTTKSGVFNFFLLLIVSEDLLSCPPHHRRAIIAHECGHLSGFHTLIWMLLGALVLNNNAIPNGFALVGKFIGPWVALGVFAAFLVLSLIGARTLLHWFEEQADDYAADRVGPTELIAALSWFNTKMSGLKRSRWVDARILRLQRLHGLHS